MKKLRGRAGLHPFSRSLRHLFGLRVLQEKLLSVNERLCLLHHVMVASHECNGAALDLAALHDWHLVSVIPVRSATQAQALIDSCCSFLPFKWDSLPLDSVKDFFGEDVATFFLFQQHLTRCSYLLAALSCVIFAFRFELNKVPFSEALWCCIVLAACSVTIITWRTRHEEFLYSWGASSKFACVGCAFRQQKEIEESVVALANPKVLKAVYRKYFSLCVVMFAAVSASACICAIVALAVRNQCTNVRSQELFDERRVVLFAFAEAVRALGFRYLLRFPFQFLTRWIQTTSLDLPAVPSFNSIVMCDVSIFVLHLLNLLPVPIYLVFFVAVDPQIQSLGQRTVCLKVRLCSVVVLSVVCTVFDWHV
jgi:hypothetical protein